MQEHNYSIKKWAKDDRPREKLRNKGAQHLTDSELLAILIRNGARKKTAVDLAKDILSLGRNNLSILSKLSLKDLMKVSGIGEAKALAIVAYRETNGPFASVDELLEVKGIGKAILDRNRDKLEVN